jgi:hypothetical protein
MKNRNSASVLFEWAENSLVESSLPKDVQKDLLKEAIEVIAKGGWRGDISQRWREKGYSGKDIPDFYP